MIWQKVLPFVAMISSHLPRMSRDEIRALSRISPEMQDFLDTHPIPSLGDFNDVLDNRAGYAKSIERLLDRLGPVESSLEELEISIPVRDGWTSKALICRPSPTAGKPPGPLIVLYHGGGFMVGSPGSMTPYARGLVRLFNAVVVSPSYRLAPENKFPTGINDAWDALQWIGDNVASLRADPKMGFIVGGGSSGGNFAAVLARRAVEEKLVPALTGQWVAVPVLYNRTGDTVLEKYKHIWTSWEQNKDALLISAKGADILFGHYSPDFQSSLFNPMNSNTTILSKLPKAFIQVAGMDLVRDDGILYSYALDDAGVAVRLEAYPGVPHSFWAFVPNLEQSKAAMVDIAEGFGWMLGTTVDRERAAEAMLKNYLN